MVFLNRVLLDVAAPPQVTDAVKLTDNAGTLPVIIVLGFAAAVFIAAVVLLIYTARKRNKSNNKA